MVELATPVTLAVPASAPPTTLKGQVGETTSAVLLPFFMPVVLMGTADGNEQSITANIYVGGMLA